MKSSFKIIAILFTFLISFNNAYSAEKVELLKTDWSFKGLFGKFDRSALQRGYQVYTEVCSSCHSMKYLSYRNLAEKGGPEFSEEQAKAIAASFDVKDDALQHNERYLDLEVCQWPAGTKTREKIRPRESHPCKT